MPDYKTSFNPEWSKKYPWVKPNTRDNYKVSCSLCKSEISVANKGEGALSQHMNTDKHKTAEKAAAKTISIRDHFNRMLCRD